MEPIDENLAAGDDRRFDLLVDGELSEADRRELLASLDNEPGGWRHCALAFLEAQCWKEGLQEQLAAAAGRPADAAARPVAQPAAGRWRSGRRKLLQQGGTLLAMAASFLVALTLFSHLPEAWHRKGQDSLVPARDVAATTPANPPANVVAVAASTSPAAAPPLQQDARLVAAQEQQIQPGRWETVTLTVPGGPQGRQQSMVLPAVERNAIDDNWLRSLPSALPADVLQALERTGYRINQHRELLPLQMNDGRRLVVPVDQVEVHYVGNPTY